MYLYIYHTPRDSFVATLHSTELSAYLSSASSSSSTRPLILLLLLLLWCALSVTLVHLGLS